MLRKYEIAPARIKIAIALACIPMLLALGACQSTILKDNAKIQSAIALFNSDVAAIAQDIPGACQIFAQADAVYRASTSGKGASGVATAEMAVAQICNGPIPTNAQQAAIVVANAYKAVSAAVSAAKKK